VRSGYGCHLQIVGPFYSNANEVFEARRARSRYRDDIEYAGVARLQELPRILGGADLFLHLKVGDWCPNAVVEALSCGLPIVCPAWGGTKELIGPAGIAVDGPAWTFNRQLGTGMAEAVMHILGDLAIYKERARATALARFDVSMMVDQYLSLLHGGAPGALPAA
jgi:phosphatidyl-myo-inositol alpha-mannosyltransferase